MAGRRGSRSGRAWLGSEPCGPEPQGPPCDCRTAVRRAYDGMLAAGTPASQALTVAIRVYRYHHPQAEQTHAEVTVESWVFSGPLH